MNSPHDPPRPIQRVVLSPPLWEDLLVEHGLLIDQFSLITAPEVDSPVSCTLIHARRPPA